MPEPGVRILRAVLDAIVSHARAERPRECCGLLIGVDGVVIDAVATANAAAEPLRQYEIPPREHIRLLQRCRALTVETGRRHDVVGAYHSHPHGAAVPSPTDLAQAFTEFLYVITGPADAEATETCAYRLTGDRFAPVSLGIEQA